MYKRTCDSWISVDRVSSNTFLTLLGVINFFKCLLVTSHQWWEDFHAYVTRLDILCTPPQQFNEVSFYDWLIMVSRSNTMLHMKDI